MNRAELRSKKRKEVVEAIILRNEPIVLVIVSIEQYLTGCIGMADGMP